MSRHARLTELFTEAIGLPPGARGALVDAVRAGEPDLVDNLVALLAADAASAVTALRTGALAPTLVPTASEVAMTLPPDIPGFRLIGVIGDGGMGTVYAAEQDNPRRPVAIKLLRARARAALVRFWAEADILARLDHPGIVRVLAAGQVDDRPYLVMERVDGVTLDRHVRAVRPPLPLTQKLALVASICDAVHHAHVHGVIHRDLKPSNLMVQGDRITVLDFGVARATADDGTTPGATRAGELIGTPIYMSPEQARLRPDEVDARSDVYSLGVILYELCAGALPYEIGGAALPEVTRAICHDAPRPLGRHDPALRGDLEAIAAKALAKLPADRYQSAAALADDLRAVLELRPVSARNPGTVEQLARFVRRRPWTAAAIAGAVIAVAAFTIVVTGLWLDARAARRRAEVARAELELRSNQLVLRHARDALVDDPTAALAWLGTLTPRGVDAEAAWAIADEAIGRGVARHVVRGHSSDVHRIAALPDDTGFVSVGYDDRVLRWDEPPVAGHLLFAAPSGDLTVAVPSPDGARIAIGGGYGVLVVVDRDGAVLATPAVHAGDVQRLVWSRDGAWLVTADDHGGVWRWPRGVGAGTRMPGTLGEVTGLVLTDDDRGVILGDEDGALWTWRFDAAAPARIPGTGAAAIVGLWSDGARVVAVDELGTIRAWDRTDAAPVRVIATGLACKRGEIAAGGGWEVLAGLDGRVMRVEGDAIETVTRHRDQARTIAVSRDGRWIASGADDGSIHVVDRVRHRTLDLRGHREKIRHVVFARGDTELLSADGGGTVRRWSLVDPSTASASASPGAGAGAVVIGGTGAAVVHLAGSADGRRIAALDDAGELVVWDATDGGALGGTRLAGHPRGVAFAGDAVVAVALEGAAVWWTPAGEVRRELGARIEAIEVAPDGGEVAIATADGPIARFTAGGEPLLPLSGHASGTDAIAYAPDGAWLASGGEDRVIRLWRRDGARFVAAGELAGTTADTHFVAFAPRGDALIAGSDDGTVRAWTIEAGAGGAAAPASARLVTRHGGAVTALAFDPSGGAVVTAGRDGTLARIDLATGAATTTRIGASTIALAISADHRIRAVTAGGGVERWDGTAAPPVRTIDDGIHAAIALGAAHDRWAVALEDGAIAIATTAPVPRTLAALFELIRARDLPPPVAPAVPP